MLISLVIIAVGIGLINARPQTSSNFGAAARPLVYFYGPAALALAIIIVGASVSNRPPSDFVSDPLAIGGMPPYVGALSHLGVLGWCAAASILLFSGVIVLTLGGRAAHRADAAYLMSLGAYTAMLAIDDLFMVHEYIPRYTRDIVSEPFVLLVYAIIGLGIFATFFSRLLNVRTPLLVSSGSLFVASLLIDLQHWNHHWWPMLEDGLKFLGIAGWLGFSALTALDCIKRAVASKEGGWSDRELHDFSAADRGLRNGGSTPQLHAADEGHRTHVRASTRSPISRR